MRVVSCVGLGLCVLAAICSAQLGDILSPVSSLTGGGGAGDLLSGLTGVLGEGPLSSLTGLLTNVGGLSSLVSGLTDGLTGGGAPLQGLLAPVLSLVLSLLQVVLQLVGVLVQVLGGTPNLGEALQGALNNPVVQSQLNSTLTTLANTLASGLQLNNTGEGQPDTLNNLLYLATERQGSDTPLMTVVRSVVALVLMLLQTLLGPAGLDNVVKIDPVLLSGFLNGALTGLLGVDLTTAAP